MNSIFNDVSIIDNDNNSITIRSEVDLDASYALDFIRSIEEFGVALADEKGKWIHIDDEDIKLRGEQLYKGEVKVFLVTRKIL